MNIRGYTQDPNLIESAEVFYTNKQPVKKKQCQALLNKSPEAEIQWNLSKTDTP